MIPFAEPPKDKYELITIAAMLITVLGVFAIAIIVFDFALVNGWIGERDVIVTAETIE